MVINIISLNVINITQRLRGEGSPGSGVYMRGDVSQDDLPKRKIIASAPLGSEHKKLSGLQVYHHGPEHLTHCPGAILQSFGVALAVPHIRAELCE